MDADKKGSERKEPEVFRSGGVQTQQVFRVQTSVCSGRKNKTAESGKLKLEL